MKTKILFLCTGNSCRSQIAEGWAPLMFVIIYVVGVCLFLPGTLLTALGAAIFGPYWGFLYVWTGAMIGAGLAFLIGRILPLLSSVTD